jgi:hypothetical protein
MCCVMLSCINSGCIKFCKTCLIWMNVIIVLGISHSAVVLQTHCFGRWIFFHL